MGNQGNIFQRLFAVPKNEILKLLRLHHGDDELINVFEEALGHPLTLEEVRRLPHSDLIRVAQASERFTEDDVIYLDEEFRYVGTKTFYIYSYEPSDRELLDRLLASDDQAELNDAIRSEYGRQTGEGSSLKFSDLSIREIERFVTDDQSIWELVYSYIAMIRTTNPETEEAQFTRDLRYGFIWVNRTTPWVVISAKDESIAVIFSKALARMLQARIIRLPIPKDVEIAVESYEHMRRASHVDGRGVRTRISHEQLHSYQDEIEEIQQRDQEQVRTSSGYNAEIDGITFALGYSREKGAISFSKLLRTTQLRQFGVYKITSIYEAIQEMREQSPDDFVPIVVNRVLSGSRATTKELIQEIISKLAMARQGHLDEVELDTEPFDIAKLSNYFTYAAEIHCSDCDDLQYVQCSECGNERFIFMGENLVCSLCDTRIETGEIRCIFGHEGYVQSPHEVISLYPTRSMLAIVEATLYQAARRSFNRYEEGFFIRGNTLHIFGARGEKIVYLMEELPEFEEPAELALTDTQINMLRVLLSHYGEKCGEMAFETCEQCVEDRVSPHCLMRLYGLYDHRYTPRPHHGGEFGDVSLSITIDGHQDQVLTVLLKKGNPNGHPITLRHSIGRDIYTQVEEFWTNPNTAMIGIGVPQRLEDGFVANLQRLARRNRKKLLFFGVDELSKILQYVLDRDQLLTDDL